MTATVEPQVLPDAGSGRCCGDVQWDHKRGKGGCKVPGCGCEKYLPPKDRPAPAADIAHQPGPECPACQTGETSRSAHTIALGQPVDEPVAQAEVQDLTDVVDAGLRPVAELMEADQPTERLDRCGHCTLIPSVRGQVRATQVGCPQHGSRAVAAAAAVEPAPIVEAQRVADVAAHVDAKRVEQQQRLTAQVAQLTAENERLRHANVELGQARAETDRLARSVIEVTGERDRARADLDGARGALVEAGRAGVKERKKHADEVARLTGELEHRRVEVAELRAALQGPDITVLFRYDADQCTTEGCGSRYTVPVEHPHPLTPVTVLVVRREVPGA